MRLAAALIGDLSRMMAEEVRAAERAVTAGVRDAADGLKAELRGQITGADLGERLARTWRGEVYPKGQQSIAAAGFVWSKAPGIVRVYEDGAVIRSTRGLFLAIPTDAAGGSGDGGAKITPGGWERRTGQRLRFVYRRGAPSLLVADNLRARRGKRGGFARASAAALRTGRGLVTVPIFILVPQVTVKKRLDVAGAAARWQARLPQLVLRHWRAASKEDG
ncbi:DUF6441 family protein [Elioraea sp.]|uniref:DUF6441 family protein n=1 Tax=Elioraea sp. TaxID=2185103 RepID=UPI00307F17B0